MEVVSENAARAVIDIVAAIDLMEKTFASLAMGDCEIFPVVQGQGSLPGSRFGVKSGSIARGGIPGLKVGSYWPSNSQRGLPNHGSTTLLLDPSTGYPQALVAASHLNGLRTAGADGVAIKHLARPDAQRLGIVGSGHQAWYEVTAARAVRDIREVLVWSRDASRASAFADRVARELHVTARVASLADAAGSDIVITVTAATEPLLRRQWIRPGTHISAMGADAPGKQELEVELVGSASLFADVVGQSIVLGEFEGACRDGVILAADIKCLGDVVNGRSEGRKHSADITVFDSSGTAAQDLAIAHYALGLARNAGLVQQVTLMDEARASTHQSTTDPPTPWGT